MEGAALVFIGAALFSHAWYVLGLYPDGRTMGFFAAALGLAALITLVFDPMLLVEVGKKVGGQPQMIAADDVLAEVTLMKMLIILWAGYGLGVGAQGLFDFDGQAIGFYSAVLVAASLITFIYFAVELQDKYGDGVWLSLSGASLILTILAGMLFFYQAIPRFSGIQPVAGWFILVGSIPVIAFGLAMVTTAIKVV